MKPLNRALLQWNLQCWLGQTGLFVYALYVGFNKRRKCLKTGYRKTGHNWIRRWQVDFLYIYYWSDKLAIRPCQILKTLFKDFFLPIKAVGQLLTQSCCFAFPNETPLYAFSQTQTVGFEIPYRSMRHTIERACFPGTGSVSVWNISAWPCNVQSSPR